MKAGKTLLLARAELQKMLRKLKHRRPKGIRVKLRPIRHTLEDGSVIRAHVVEGVKGRRMFYEAFRIFRNGKLPSRWTADHRFMLQMKCESLFWRFKPWKFKSRFQRRG